LKSKLENTIRRPRYAIIDVETTGTGYKTGKITEIAIIIHDGREVVDSFNTLINPEQKIPWQIQQLTGISNAMVENAPKFYEVAKKIVEMTGDCIFVAHNASFDYNFIRQEFEYLGYDYRREKICTVKLSRKLIPHKRSYSLKNICQELNIANTNPHRAFGDAAATTKLFELLLSIDPNPAEINLQGLNSRLQPETIKNLPEAPGVYFFLDDEARILYVGKSKNIKARVMSHLSNCATKRALEMKNAVAEIHFELTGNELIALLLEAHEIGRHLPLYNRAQRRTMFNHGLFDYVDENGYLRLKVCKLDDCNGDAPLTTFNSVQAAKNYLFQLCETHNLCQKLCGLDSSRGSCFQYKIKECYGACLGEEPPESYNKRAEAVIGRFAYSQSSFLIIGQGRRKEESSVIWIENGRYHGFGFADTGNGDFQTPELLKEVVKPYTENKYVHSIIKSYLHHNPRVKVINLRRNDF
jgi:DNA polymerase III subunit epsilon